MIIILVIHLLFKNQSHLNDSQLAQSNNIYNPILIIMSLNEIFHICTICFEFPGHNPVSSIGFLLFMPFDMKYLL